MVDKSDAASRGTVLKAIGPNRIDHPAVLEAVRDTILNGSNSKNGEAVDAFGAIGHPEAQYRSVIEQLAADSTGEGLHRAVLAVLKTVN